MSLSCRPRSVRRQDALDAHTRPLSQHPAIILAELPAACAHDVVGCQDPAAELIWRHRLLLVQVARDRGQR